MLPKGTHIDGTPTELKQLLHSDIQAKTFYESLSKSCKQAYCDWVGGAKKQETRDTRAAKALVMLQKCQKTLKV